MHTQGARSYCPPVVVFVSNTKVLDRLQKYRSYDVHLADIKRGEQVMEDVVIEHLKEDQVEWDRDPSVVVLRRPDDLLPEIHRLRGGITEHAVDQLRVPR